MLVTDHYEGYIHYIQGIYKITENKVVNLTTTLSPVALQVVAMTTHGATNGDEVAKPTGPALSDQTCNTHKILKQESVKSNNLNK